MELYNTIDKDQVYFNSYNHCPKKKKKCQVITLFTGKCRKQNNSEIYDIFLTKYLEVKVKVAAVHSNVLNNIYRGRCQIAFVYFFTVYLHHHHVMA